MYEARLIENRLQRLENECASRPKGSIILKPRYREVYAYLQWREGAHVLSRYLGKKDSWQCRSMQAKIVERRKYEIEMKHMREKLRRVRHLLNEAQKIS
jgi:hypothetical protein